MALKTALTATYLSLDRKVSQKFLKSEHIELKILASRKKEHQACF